MNRIIVIILVFMLLIGCQSSLNTGQTEQLTEEGAVQVSPEASTMNVMALPTNDIEYAILSTAGADHNFVYDVEVFDPSFQRAEFWIDLYEDGEYVDFLFSNDARSHYFVEGINTFRLYFSVQQNDHSQNTIFNLATRVDHNVGRGQYSIPSRAYIGAGKQMYSVEALEKETEYILGVLSYQVNEEKDGIITGEPNSMILSSDFAYVLKVKYY